MLLIIPCVIIVLIGLMAAAANLVPSDVEDQKDAEAMRKWCGTYFPAAGPNTCAAKWFEIQRQWQEYRQ
jgi:hypothetical protein